MGIELLIGAAVAAASVATGVMQMSAAKKANKAREEANKVQTADQKNQARETSRRAIREARIRRAMILQQSENTGTQASSGQIGAVGVVGTYLGNSNAVASMQTKAIEGINSWNQKAANYDYKASQWGMIGNIFSSAVCTSATAAPSRKGTITSARLTTLSREPGDLANSLWLIIF